MDELETKPEKPNPELALVFHQVFCLIHGEPFRKNWPAGYLQFALAQLRVLLEDETFTNEVAGVSSTSEMVKADVKNIMPLLDKVPICCRLGRDRLLRGYLTVHKEMKAETPFRTAPCSHCKNFLPGNDFRMAGYRTEDGTAVRKPQLVKHLCLRCVAKLTGTGEMGK